MALVHDGNLTIAVARNRFETAWRNVVILWSALVEWFAVTKRTDETQAEFLTLDISHQTGIKDRGALFGGETEGGQRSTATIASRSMLTFDVDGGPVGLWDTIKAHETHAICMHTTHKHRPDAPRLRIFLPLSRPITADEYRAVSRAWAAKYGIGYFDVKSFDPVQMMFLPTTSCDGEYLYEVSDGPWLDPDELLAESPDWKDISRWPESAKEVSARTRAVMRQADPTKKKGLIGVFCRVYDIPAAIDAYLSTVYAQCRNSPRYTFLQGSTTGGLVLYENGKFAYSHHGTDPAQGRLLNAFDMVRIHRFGDLDRDTAPDTRIDRLPSYLAMLDLVRNDERVRVLLAESGQAEAEVEFGEDGSEKKDWRAGLQYGRHGELLNKRENLVLILKNDAKLQGIATNQFSGAVEIRGTVPWPHPNRYWRDADDAQLLLYLDRNYGTFSRPNYDTALAKVADDRSFHPVRDYLERLPTWDGEPRIERLLIVYLGAADTGYTRAVMRVMLVGAVARVMEPGVKFDTMLVMRGPQGIGKSTLIAILALDWFSDSLSLADTRDKTAAEKLQGYWVIEIGELAGMHKADVATLRSFLSSRNDIYRASYGRNVTQHLRQCVFFGTTNSETGYLRDTTGNRRFLPVETPGGGIKAPWDLSRAEVNQVWAEALALYRSGHSLELDPGLKQEAEMEQREAMESDDREGLVREYLDRLLPEDWNRLDLYARRAFLAGSGFGPSVHGTVRRERVCVLEVWCECFCRDASALKRSDSYEINGILKHIEGWTRIETAKAAESKQGLARFPIYGIQRGFMRVDINKIKRVRQQPDPDLFDVTVNNVNENPFR